MCEKWMQLIWDLLIEHKCSPETHPGLYDQLSSIIETEVKCNTRPQTAAVPVEEWLSIDTAPKDGTVVDLWYKSPTHEYRLAGYSYVDVDFPPLSKTWVEKDGSRYVGSGDEYITHWMPLPTPPQEVNDES